MVQFRLQGPPAVVDHKSWQKAFFAWETMLTPDINGDILVQFASPAEMQALSRKHRAIDDVTDVLSFRYDPPMRDSTGYKVAAEIIICPEQAQKFAVSHGLELKDELATLFVHGLLHIAGLDHASGNDQERFRALTRDIMKDTALMEVNLWLD